MRWLTILVLAIVIALTILAALMYASGHAVIGGFITRPSLMSVADYGGVRSGRAGLTNAAIIVSTQAG
jgi:hypothetical protein